MMHFGHCTSNFFEPRKPDECLLSSHGIGVGKVYCTNIRIVPLHTCGPFASSDGDCILSCLWTTMLCPMEMARGGKFSPVGLFQSFCNCKEARQNDLKEL